jgi:hypothetical protein
MSVIDDLKAQIAGGKITFDKAVIEDELLGESAGVKVTAKLQKLVLEVSRNQSIRISSIVRPEGHHGAGRAFDVGNEEIATALLNVFATDAKVAALEIDEIIFDAAKAIPPQTDRNKWNYDLAKKHTYTETVLKDHGNHIHFAVKS